MSFVKFTAINRRSVNKISITASNTFNFPSKFYNDNKLDKYKYVVLFYDKGRMAVGFSFINDEDEKSKLTLQKSDKGYGGFISATSFFKVNNIDTKLCKGRYDWTKEKLDDKEELFVIELKSVSERGSSS